MISSLNSKKSHSESSDGFLPRARFEYEKYVLLIIIIWGYSLLLPTMMIYYYYILIIKPDLAIYGSLSLIVTSWKYVSIILITPLFFILIYLLRLFSVAFLCKIVIKYCNFRSPRMELFSARGIGKKESKEINYYHLRGMVLRVLKWQFSKSFFPWLVPWAFDFVNTNKIGKGCVLEDQYLTQEYLETEENVYIGQGSQVSSHLVEGEYGAITLKKIKIKEGVTIGPHTSIAPGVNIGAYTELLPSTAAIKFQQIESYAKYNGLPAKKINIDEYNSMLNISIEKQKKKKKKDFLEFKIIYPKA